MLVKKHSNTIAIITAVAEEFNAIKEKMAVHSYGDLGFESISGVLNGKEVLLVKSGVGKIWAAICTQIVIYKFNPKIIINVGVAGALDPRLKTFDIVMAETVINGDVDLSSFKGYEIGQPSSSSVKRKHPARYQTIVNYIDDAVKVGTVLSKDKFLTSSNGGLEVKSKFPRATVVDMEAAAITQVAYENNISVVVFKTISDLVLKPKGLEAYCNNIERASEALANLVFKYVDIL